MSPRAAFVLFLPSYGRGGSGEFVRAVTIAQAAQQRWPALHIEFVLPGGPGTRQDAPFPRHCHDGPDETKGDFDIEQLRLLRPDIAIFDSGLRTATLREAHRLGIRTVFLSDRVGTRRKPFRLDWLRVLDEHWHQREHVTRAFFTPAQRALALASSTRRVLFDTYLPATPPREGDLPQAVEARLRAPFALFAPGGGGYAVAGRPVSELFVETAEALHQRTGLECLTLLGPLYQGSVRGEHTLTLTSVETPRFVDLMRRATLVVINGGHTCGQALACRAAIVAAPLGGSDQPPRIAEYTRARLIEPAQPTPQSLLAATSRLAQDAAHREAMRGRVAAHEVTDGVPRMLDSLALSLAPLQPR